MLDLLLYILRLFVDDSDRKANAKPGQPKPAPVGCIAVSIFFGLVALLGLYAWISSFFQGAPPTP